MIPASGARGHPATGAVPGGSAPPGGDGGAGRMRVIVVLGCAVAFGESGRLAPGPLQRRVETAVGTYADLRLSGVAETLVIASGGRRWGRAVEADAMAAELSARGVPASAIIRERASLSTRDNARFAAAALARRGLRSALLVTCAWHMPRALALFARAGVDVTPVAAAGPRPTTSQKLWRRAREGWLAWFIVLAACSTSPARAGGGGGADGGVASIAPAGDGPATRLRERIEKAQDQRRPQDLPPEAATSSDVRERRAYARALAEIGGTDDAELLRALNDEDPETVRWAAYGVGQGCAEGDPARVSALAARLAALGTARDAPASPESRFEGGAAGTLLWALGHCGGDLAAQAIDPWLRAPAPVAEAAAYALGEAVARAGALSPAQAAALLDAAEGSPPVGAAFYAFSHPDRALPPGLSQRLAAAAQKAIARPSELRVLAIRARGLAGDDAATGDLLPLLTSADALGPERIEAARALGRLGKAGQTALADAVVALPRSADALLDPAATVPFVSALAILRALSGAVAPRAEPALWAIARLEGPAAGEDIRRRASLLRCAAALALARGSWESDVLARCDVGDGEIGERARLEALDRRALGPAGRTAWTALLASPHLRVREAALDLASRHPELGDAARTAIAAALGAPEPGIVATAARALHARPDPGAATLGALRAALAHPWPLDATQTRLALLDAAESEAAATAIPEARAFAEAACADPNGAVRARAARVLAALGAGEAADGGEASCAAPESAPPAPEIGHEASRPFRVTLDTDHGELVLHLDPRFAPVAVTRIVALARSGFYDGTVVHRVVPGFVVQFGDPGGDGYGGAGRLLRCETAPVAFDRLDVGVALAGRDTGSSQIFVTLARSPHLDGEYAWLGTADETERGDWDGVVEGDVIRAVHVDP
jgi:cyclophilin family peptidyl-prolyl cis-trans isomerase/vancomycin permeability regulator SanA